MKAAPPQRLRLAYQGLAIEVQSAAPSHLHWLEEFLSPHFEPSAGSEPAWLVEVIEDDHGWKAMRATGSTAVGEIDCFALDSSVVRLPLWRQERTAATVFDEDYQVFYAVERESRRVTILSPDSNPSLRTPLMRVIRELAMNHCHQLGGLFLHASCVDVDGQGVVVTGRKAAGKTTLLMHLLGDRRSRYIANDRLLIPAGPRPLAFGLPSVVTIRPRTLELFPRIAERLQQRGYRQQLTIGEARVLQQPPRPWGDGRYGMTPAQLCDLLGTTPCRATRPAAILFPHVTEQPGTISLLPLTSEAAGERLIPSLLGAGTWKKHSDFFTLSERSSPGPDEATLISRCHSLAAEVPAFECVLGWQAYEDVDIRDALLERLATMAGGRARE